MNFDWFFLNHPLFVFFQSLSPSILINLLSIHESQQRTILARPQKSTKPSLTYSLLTFIIRCRRIADGKDGIERHSKEQSPANLTTVKTDKESSGKSLFVYKFDKPSMHLNFIDEKFISKSRLLSD